MLDKKRVPVPLGTDSKEARRELPSENRLKILKKKNQRMEEEERWSEEVTVPTISF